MVSDVERLSEGRDIVAVLRGRRRRVGHLVCLHVAESESSVPRVAVVASKRVGGAVQRNRAKRLLREASRRISWSEGLDVVLVARAACADSALDDVLSELSQLGDQLEAVS